MGIDGKTRIFGILGYPVEHSLSPGMHNAAFSHLGINAVYTAFEVEPRFLGNAIGGIKGLGISGVNVTIPHKETAIKYLDSLSYEAKLTGAVNTVVKKNGRLCGYNTDVLGFIRSLKEDLRFSPGNKTIFIIGAGGAAKAAGFGLALGGAKRIILTDVMEEKALELVCDIELKTGCECIALKSNSPGVKDMILNSQLLVNCTPCGMKDKDPIVIDPDFMHERLCVFDLVYNRKTKLIKAAEKRGVKAAGGLNMLLYQGAKAFELWTGKKAPLEAMRKALRNADSHR